MVRKNVEMLQTAASKAVSIELCLAAELPVIMADDAQLQQVVMNLITNAAESIEVQPGSIRLTTGTRSCDDDCLTASLLEKRPEMGNFVFLEVSDNGCGMSAEVRKRLFEPFFTTKFTGRGLGMSAVMGIMTSHGGALFVESEPGVGTTFTALFPIPRTVPGETEKRQSHHHLDLTLEGEGTNILSEQPILALQRLSGTALVVDDEKSVLRVAKTMVTHCGFTVITAVDGVDAVAQFRAHADDIVVVLMDLTMPNMNGLTAMSEIYAIRPDVKIILASGFNEEELSGRLTGQPPSGFIRKPYNMKGLEAELRRVVPM
jgi:CheY-like chemotaxis protein